MKMSKLKVQDKSSVKRYDLKYGLRQSLLAASILACWSQAYAADQSQEETSSSKSKQVNAAQLDTIVVTATRREQSLQKVPIAVSVVNGKDLEQKQKNALESIVSEIPSVNFRSGASNKDTSLFVRGVGTVTTSPGVEPSVSTVVDGVVYSRPGQATLDLLDVDRIEVLRGPQGTLFGKNSTAGVVNIVTKPPTEKPSGFIDLYATSDGEQRVRVGASGALIPNVLKANVTALVGRYDGNVKNVNTQQDLNGYKNQGFRTKFEYNPTDNLTIGFIADYMHKDATSPRVVTANTSSSFASALSPVVASKTNRDTNTDINDSTEDTNKGVALTADYTTDNHQWSSITAWRQWRNRQIQDQDYLSAPTTSFSSIDDFGTVNSRQLSQEFRVKNLDDGFFNYVAGLYFSKNDIDETYQRRSTWYDSSISDYSNDVGRAVYSVKSTNYAIFGEGTFNFTDRFRFISGLRVTRDELSYAHQRTSNVPTSVGTRNSIRSSYGSSGSTSSTGVSGRIGPQFDITPNINTYFTYSRGYKGPAYNVYFNMQSVDRPVVDPETSNSYELGLKSLWLDKKLRVNLAAFYTQYHNYQANYRTIDTTTGTVSAITRLVNAGDVSTKGIELDSAYKPNENLSYSLSLANIHARIDKFTCPVGDTSCPNVNGKPLPYSPDWKINAQVDKFIPLASGNKRIELSTQYSWQSETQYDINQYDNTVQPAYGIWNASIALNNLQSKWRVAFIVRNILDKSYATLLSASGTKTLRLVPRDDQRYFGLSFRKDF
ncbi:MAG: TonB-dependent receptor [Acinetobacter sp.]